MIQHLFLSNGTQGSVQHESGACCRSSILYGKKSDAELKNSTYSYYCSVYKLKLKEIDRFPSQDEQDYDSYLIPGLKSLLLPSRV